MKTDNPELAKAYSDCAKKARLETNNCLFPGCHEKSINSHIMQKNGILSTMAENRHLWEFSVDQFRKEYFYFKKTGINEIYTFLGYCKEHDSKVFQKIEKQGEINFNDYESCALFTLRTLCNEVWLKMVVKNLNRCMLDNPNIQLNEAQINGSIRQGDIAIKDLKFYENHLWEDLNSKTQSFIFEWRELPKQEICLNAIFTYDTSEEIQEYFNLTGRDKPRLVEIFISFFPYMEKSILIMGYHKEDTKQAKPFVNSFIKENIKRVNRKLSNLIILNSETWVCSPKFYRTKFEGLDSEFFKAAKFSHQNHNERRLFNINLFDTNFKDQFRIFVKEFC